MLGAFILAAALSVLPGKPAPFLVEPDGWSAIGYQCGQWERVDEATWRAEGRADLEFDTPDDLPGADTKTEVSRVDVTQEHASDLYWTLESGCREDADGGFW